MTPLLAVRDLPEALVFYQETLGFELAWSWGDPTHLAAVCRDQVALPLPRKPDGRAADPPGSACASPVSRPTML